MPSLFKTFCRNVLLAAVAWLVGFSFVYAYADEPLPPSVDSSTYTTVRGTARFEKHRTVTPRYYTLQGCAEPQPYWALVIDAASGQHFEVDQIFALGETQAPATIELAHVVIKPGMQLSLQGHVDVESRAYAVVSEVQSVEVGHFQLMAEERGNQTEGAPFFGWTCRSQGEALPVYVDVEQVSRGGGYAMRVQGETSENSSSVRTLASFDSVSLALSSSSIEFAGVTDLLRADLNIDQRSGRLSALESTLKMTGSTRTMDVRLICDRTR